METWFKQKNLNELGMDWENHLQKNCDPKKSKKQ